MARIVLNGIIRYEDYTFSRDYNKGFMLIGDNGEHFVFCYDDGQCCCEIFEVQNDFDVMTKSTILGNNGCVIDITKIGDGKYEYEPYGYYISVEINDMYYNIKVTNTHNGFYSHAVLLGTNGEYEHNWI